ncbi:porin family protein [Oceanihabitans sp. 2_MG-2023]|uniref:outer membrane beta-barrel protein n=1 Tax=Oceanihabitans sp. 2_MG-2023 TaxID=3062661 RepID=UPI0026E1E544|nr:outer membrane beta-barrel protein [Oceanihabitans sp. 2_MG-2023]MDO6596060.1 porin family protein [Oceanihabitans sp. 2_MG-2023]
MKFTKTIHKNNVFNTMKISKNVQLTNNPIMKTKNSLFVCVLIFLFATQMQAQIAIGGGLGYNEKISGPGVTLKGVFNITDNIAITPSASYFFGNQVYGYKRSLFAGDVNAHYYFNIIESKLKVYPVVGVNFSSYKTGNSYYDAFFDYETEQVTDSAIGGNIGAGATYQFTDKLKVYLEPKFVASNYSQVVINAGVLLNL